MQPTPTALPPVNAPLITINPDDYRIWQFADEAIQIWNHQPNFGLIVQWAIIIIITVAFVALMIKLLQGVMEQE